MGSLKEAVVRPAVQGAIVSFAASTVKSITEPMLEKAFDRLFPPTPQQLKLVGADPAGHLDNMPPAVIANEFSEAVYGKPLDKSEKLKAQQVIHYGFGAVVGAAYGVATANCPAIGRGLGIPAGLALYGTTHATLLPLFGVQQPPWKMPLSAVCWEATSHAVFGATLEIGLRLLRGRKL
ncbi:DUF1440 domain-containing protein [Nocardia camponoti]|uniref:DUF1440 domain-containing protein n=1 Tax=Nocardia camponoti TaxID=1616106 RepID=A0A917V6C4_9NOCA|nr:DUF1440 domain-containing protein [Nocardia camponoti]GGK44127.1 hypothetical protein GCM10011591_14580 [Nocardia camponoti]